MFKNLFNKNNSGKINSNESESSENPKQIAFEILVLIYLKKHGIGSDGKKLHLSNTIEKEDEQLVKQALETLGFVDNIEEVIINEWEQRKEHNNFLTPSDFVGLFLSEFHNSKVEVYAPNFVRERNKKILDAYRYVILTIEKIQGWLDDEFLRTRIESNFKNKQGIQSTLLQCTTPFCIVSLGCDPMGRYNIVYSVDFRFQEMISEDFASSFIRRIYQFTPGEMEPFVRIGSLHTDCIEVFNKTIELIKTEPFHTVNTQAKHTNE